MMKISHAPDCVHCNTAPVAGVPWRSLWPACVMVLLAAIIPARETLLTISQQGPIAIVFPLSQNRNTNWSHVLAAGGMVIRETLGGWVLIVQPGHDAFLPAIQASGIWATLNPLILGGCGSGQDFGLGHKRGPPGKQRPHAQ